MPPKTKNDCCRDQQQFNQSASHESQVGSQHSQSVVSCKHQSRGISIVRSRYLPMTSKDNRLRSLSVWCSYLQSAQIGESIIIICS
jgi:hypothetical protein